MAKLILAGSEGLQECRVRNAVRMGREKKVNDLPIPDKRSSREHAVVFAQGEGALRTYWVKDLDSRNGTLLNGKPIPQMAQLKDGDRLKIGETEILFVLDPEEASNAPLPTAQPALTARKKALRPSFTYLAGMWFAVALFFGACTILSRILFSELFRTWLPSS